MVNVEYVTFEICVAAVGQEPMVIRVLISGLIPRVSMIPKVTQKKQSSRQYLAVYSVSNVDLLQVKGEL